MTDLTINNNFLTTSQVAKLLHVSRFTVLHWIKQGKIKAVATLGGHQRIPKDSLSPFLRKTNLLNRIKPQIFGAEEVMSCWESEEIKESGAHNCPHCLVYKERINRCFLSVPKYGNMRVECGTDCLNCEYFSKYYPKERRAMESMRARTVVKAVTPEQEKSRADVSMMLKEGLFHSGQYVAAIKNKLSKVSVKKL